MMAWNRKASFLVLAYHRKAGQELYDEGRAGQVVEALGAAGIERLLRHGLLQHCSRALERRGSARHGKALPM